MADINRVILVGRLTRDAEQSYTQSGYALLKFSIAVNRRRKQGDQWIDEGNFFDVTLFGRQGEAIANYMSKGRQIAVEGQLRQDRWESQDGTKRTKVSIDASYVQLIGGRDGGGARPQSDSGWSGSRPHQGESPSAAQGPQQEAQQGPQPMNFHDDIPF